MEKIQKIYGKKSKILNRMSWKNSRPKIADQKDPKI